MTLSRRGFVGASGFVVAAGGLVTGRAQAASIPEAASTRSSETQIPKAPTTGVDYQPVVTLNGWSLPWRMNGDWKEFHLVAEPVIREIAPGMKAHLWGYNGQSPGPTIEAVEGDNVRIFVTNKLPENTAVHWHGQRLPNGMDGVGGLTQPHIPPGKTFVYEFQMRRSGAFMYHPHSDEMVQMAMGMMGFLVVHPKDPAFRRVDRDFVFLLNAFDIEAGSYVPKVNTMLDFNLWTWNSRAFPGIDPLVVAKNDKVRIRFGNLTMTNHPIHMHGYEFKVSCTDGGWVDPAAAWPEVSIDCAVGQMRAFDFVADEPGDWAIHCHKSHHTMNAMGHSVKTYIGVNKKDLAKRIAKIAPGYMPMGSNGMGEMGSMEMQGPANTLPMMTGYAQFGPVEMGGMFSVVKVREGLAAGDYKDPGPFKNPEGTVAFEYKGQKLAEAPRTTGPDSGLDSVDWQVKDPRKPTLAADGTPVPAKAGGHSNH
ncbi:Multicopper oxidase with three cupredoxin domains (includes cell division protein FtsP and spore coat protein CotA) [Bosea sp. CRIB-10]|uniref:multicopper oxidase family protein n=1 Tax=Bosea sp. CRIB-10 TaxID=378404 RepID=UPI0008E962A2|nr:copper oxidase [Bosea sp. CRIB-10]SFD32363.1 Multicopper oxidase with three cupredoxin domains (includes cell division protein FtsP and spore coat protein CotA) [Bosea sp. CRIB-10]